VKDMAGRIYGENGGKDIMAKIFFRQKIWREDAACVLLLLLLLLRSIYD